MSWSIPCITFKHVERALYWDDKFPELLAIHRTYKNQFNAIFVSMEAKPYYWLLPSSDNTEMNKIVTIWKKERNKFGDSCTFFPLILILSDKNFYHSRAKKKNSQGTIMCKWIDVKVFPSSAAYLPWNHIMSIQFI